MSARKPSERKAGSDDESTLERARHESTRRLANTPLNDQRDAERFIPEPFGPLPGYEHAHRYLAASLVLAKGRVLDLASGSGAGTAALRASDARRRASSGSRGRNNGTLQVIGLDIDIAAARCSAPAVQADAVRLPFADASFDGVICFEAIEHLKDPALLLEEIRRVLRPDGLLLMSTPNRDLFTKRARRNNPFHISEMNPKELLETLERAFSSVALYSQSVWAGSWLSELHSDGLSTSKHARRRWQVQTHDLAPPGDTSPAPWADRDDNRTPAPLYLLAVCSSSVEPFERARRTLGANHLLHDPSQWLLGHYLASLGGLTERDTLIESHAMHGRNVQQRLDEANSRASSLDAHVANLESDRGRLQARVGALEKHAVNTAQAESRALERIKQLDEHAENLTAELVRAAEHREAALDHAANLDAEIGRLQQQFDGIHDHARNVESQLEEQSVHATNLDTDRRALDQHLKNLELERSHLQENLAAANEHASNVESQLEGQRVHAANLDADRQALDQHLKNLELERSRLQDSLAGASEHARNLELVHGEQTAHSAGLDAALDAEHRRADELFERTESLEQERDRWREQAESTQLELAELHASLAVRTVAWLRRHLRR